MPRAETPVSKVMQRNVISLTPGMILDDVIRLFSNYKISGAPVVNAQEEIIGILTKTDLIAYSLNCELQTYLTEPILEMLSTETLDFKSMFTAVPKPATAEDVMTRSPYTISENLSVSEAARIMIERRYHHLLVAEGGKLLGIVSPLDLLRVLTDSGE